MKVAVIGAGSWGTALAQQLARNGYKVSLWARRTEVVSTINGEHFNPRYLSDVPLSENIVATTSYRDAVDQAKAVVAVTPSKLMRETAQALAEVVDADMPVVVCSKGVENESGLLPLEVYEQEMGNAARLAVLSGPTHAEEVVKAVPSGAVIASSDSCTAGLFQELFASSTFRTYVSEDMNGVELCAAFKNVIAIAVGVAYGLGFGDNTVAMLMTRGLAEMGRLVRQCGGDPMTCMGLAGAGDLIVTCMSEHSRNRRFGKLLAEGGTLDDFTAQTHMVAEGAEACKSLRVLAQRFEVELPITEVVYNVVWQGASPAKYTEKLAARPLTTEFYGFSQEG